MPERQKRYSDRREAHTCPLSDACCVTAARGTCPQSSRPATKYAATYRRISHARPYLDPRSEDNRWRPGTLEKLEKLLGIDESDYEESFANSLNFDTETVAGRRTWLDTFPPWRPAKDLAKIMRRNRLREFVAVVPDAQRTPMARLMKEAGVHDHVGGDTRLLQVPDSLSRLELDEELKSDCPHPGVCRVAGNPDMSEPQEDCARACLGEPRPTATLSECRPMAYPRKRVRRGWAPSWCVKDHDGDALRCASSRQQSRRICTHHRSLWPRSGCRAACDSQAGKRGSNQAGHYDVNPTPEQPPADE